MYLQQTIWDYIFPHFNFLIQLPPSSFPKSPLSCVLASYYLMHDFVLFMRFVSIFAKHLAHDFCTVFLVTQKCRKIYFPGLPRKTVLAAKKKKGKMLRPKNQQSATTTPSINRRQKQWQHFLLFPR